MAQIIVTIKEGQTIYDLSLQYYDSVDAVYRILQDNPHINDIHSDITGEDLVFDVEKTDLATYLNVNNKIISTEYPKVLGDRQFDDSFDLSFR